MNRIIKIGMDVIVQTILYDGAKSEQKTEFSEKSRLPYKRSFFLLNLLR